MRNLRVEDTYFKANQINVNGNLIDFTVPKIMGILNLTEDSFYQNSRFASDLELLNQSEKMISEGATFLDLGAFSTRPNAKKVDIALEISRISSATQIILKEFPSTMVSIDTFRNDVAQAGIDAGAGIVNDISGFSFDPKMLETITRNKIPYVLMHVQGTFETMHNEYHYSSICAEVIDYFLEKISILKEHHLHDIILDPGFGFSKNIEQNYDLFRRLEQLLILNRPLLVGISRKSMIYKKLGISAEESLNGTCALNAIALTKGASILRVHDVAPAMEIVKLLSE